MIWAYVGAALVFFGLLALFFVGLPAMLSLLGFKTVPLAILIIGTLYIIGTQVDI
jgi:hypothetical protein